MHINPTNVAIALLLLISTSEAIVKQQSAGGSSSQSQSQQQARNEDQSSLLISSASPGSSSSSGGSSSSSSFQPSSSSGSNANQGASSGQQSAFSPFNSNPSAFVGLNSPSTPSSSAAISPQSSSSQVNKQSSLSNSNSNNNNIYYDNLQASASEQSYQAAANLVNSALANYAAGQQQQSASSSSPVASASSNANANSNRAQASNMQYQPVHYLYYPGSKDASGSVAQVPSKQDSSNSVSSGGNSNYNSGSYGNSYADQLMSSNGASDPVLAAASSNADPAYQLPGSSQIIQDNLYGNSQHYASNTNNPNMNSDLSAYANQLSPVSHLSGPQQPGQSSPSPSQHQPGQASNQQQQHGNVQFQQQANQQQEFNPYGPQQAGIMQASASQQQHSQVNNNLNLSQNPHQQQSAYAAQMGDLYTSNFGSASLSAPVASYMSPNSQQQASHLGANNEQFGNQHASSNLFVGQQNPGSNSMSQPAQQQQQQQQPNSMLGGMFNNAYLSSFLAQSPQFASQYAAAAAAAAANSGSSQMSGLDQSGMMASGSQPASSVAASGSQSSSKKFGISSFIMPMLALAGLSLLIPTMSNIGTAVGRKKRSIGEERASLIERQQQILYDSLNGLANQLAKESAIGEYLERIERYYSLYRNAAQNDDCMNKLICEFGDSVKGFSGKNAVITIIERFAPNWIVGKVHLFKEAAMDAKEGREKCQKYTCHHDKHFSSISGSAKKSTKANLN